MTPQEEYKELYETARMIRSTLFKKYIAEPLKEKQSKLEVDFFAEDLKKSWRNGGKHEATEDFFKMLENIENDYKNKKLEIQEK